MKSPRAFSALLAAVAIVAAPVARAGGYHVEYAFTGADLLDDADPSSPLVEVKGMLYGTTRGESSCKNGCGAVYSFDPTTGAKRTVYEFQGGADGSQPAGGLIAVHGVLYGVTSTGGGGCGGSGQQYGCGTVFSLAPATGAETVLHAFAGGADGSFPYARLVDFEGKLYGVTKYGGSTITQGSGVIFSVDPAGGAETALHAFGATINDGGYPLAGMTRVGALLYGTTSEGGNSTACNGGGCGTVFAFDPASGSESPIYAFQNGDGAYPGAVMIAAHGALYGTTFNGGGSSACSNGCGVVFALDLASGGETVLHAFQAGADGANSQSNLVRVRERLFGTTLGGGAASAGTIFSVDTATGAETVTYSFAGGQDGSSPAAGLVDSGGTLFGATLYGGSTNCGGGGCGTIYSLAP